VPPELSRAIDWSTLRLADSALVDPHLAERRADLLFSVLVNGAPALLHLLLEHRSTPHAHMPLRLLGYQVRTWERCIAHTPGLAELPPIIPVVVYHGASGWTAARSMPELFSPSVREFEALRRFVPAGDVLLFDVGRETDEALHDRVLTALGQLVLVALKNVSASRVSTEWIGRHAALIAAVVMAPGGVAALEVLLRYLLETTEYATDELWSVLRSELPTETLETIMTTVERWREEGRKLAQAAWTAEQARAAEARGEARGRAAVLLTLLTRRFGPVPRRIENRVQRASLASLDRWAARVLTASSIEQVFE